MDKNNKNNNSKSPRLHRRRGGAAASVTRIVKCAILVFIVAMFAWKSLVGSNKTIGGNTPPVLRKTSAVSSSSTVTFSLLVTLEFTSLEDKTQFLQDIQPVADYVKRHELDTLGYEVLLSDKNPLQVLILERYRDKEVAYLKVHKSSPEFLAFRPKLQAMQESGRVKVAGQSYLDANVGFVGRGV